MQNLSLSESDYKAILDDDPMTFCPDLADIKVGDRVMVNIKVGGKRQLRSGIISKAPYHPDERGYTYVDVYGYGFHTPVNVKKLKKLLD